MMDDVVLHIYVAWRKGLSKDPWWEAEQYVRDQLDKFFSEYDRIPVIDTKDDKKDIVVVDEVLGSKASRFYYYRVSKHVDEDKVSVAIIGPIKLDEYELEKFREFYGMKGG